MAIYEFKCDKCGGVIEKVQPYEADYPMCCGELMRKLPTCPAMVYWKNDGGYPSNIRQGKGTAPFTGYRQNYK